MYLENIKSICLIDTGSAISCISESFYEQNLNAFTKCPKLPLTNTQVVGFNNSKSSRLKIQLLIKVKIENFCTDLTFIVVPKLVKNVILGIDSIKQLKMIINTSENYIKFDNNSNINIKYSKLSINDKNSNNIINELSTRRIAVEESAELPFFQSDAEMQEEIMKKVEAADGLTNNEKLQMSTLLRKYSFFEAYG